MRIKHLIKKGVAKIAPSLMDMLRQLRHIEGTVKHLDSEIAELKSAISSKNHDTRLDMLKTLVTRIEQYQPAYGVQGVIDNPKRGSHDRCLAIESALKPLLGKRILDIGSSFGYASFYMADRGAVVEAWDMHAINVEISQRIGDINGIGVKFRTNELTTDTVSTISNGKFDAVLLLSVFHHIIRFQGLKQTQHIVKELIKRIPVMVVELARKGEDPSLPWDATQPIDELAIFDLIKDEVIIKQVGEFGNHLSDKSRPLYLVERKKIVKVNGNNYIYKSVTSEAYKDSPVARYPVVRRYYFDDKHIIKEYIFEADSFGDNVVQILNEIQLLINTVQKSNIYHAPKILDFEVNRYRSCLVLERINGELASDADFTGKIDEVKVVTLDVLKTLADLHKINLYHNDVRSWNVIVDNHGSGWLIDYGMSGVLKQGDDIISLLWMIEAMLKGEREMLNEKESTLPSESSFKDPTLLKLYEAVKKGERSPEHLLSILKAPDSRVKHASNEK